MNDVHGRLSICIAQIQRETTGQSGPVAPPPSATIGGGMRKPAAPTANLAPQGKPAISKPFKPIPKPSLPPPSTTVNGLDLDSLIKEALPEDAPQARKPDPTKLPPSGRKIYDADQVKPEED